MLMRCNPGCKEKGGTTEGLLDPETDEVMCTHCGDELTVSSFTKRTLRSSGDVLKKKAKAFNFKCLTCNKNVNTACIDNEIRGEGCDKKCEFSLTRFMIHSIKEAEKVEKQNENL